MLVVNLDIWGKNGSSEAKLPVHALKIGYWGCGVRISEQGSSVEGGLGRGLNWVEGGVVRRLLLKHNLRDI